MNNVVVAYLGGINKTNCNEYDQNTLDIHEIVKEEIKKEMSLEIAFEAKLRAYPCVSLVGYS